MDLLITIGEVVFVTLVICGIIVFVDAIKNAPEYNDEQVDGDGK